MGARPTLLERDFNFPPYAELRGELQHIRQLMAAHAGTGHD
ncbi:multinuclear nonheme iron-dependent oxidase [Acinetobacter baumannii]